MILELVLSTWAAGQRLYPLPDTATRERMVREALETTLRDAASARIQMGAPTCGTDLNLLNGQEPQVGMIEDIQVNAKNGFGAYAGYQPFIVFYDREGPVEVVPKDNMSLSYMKWDCRQSQNNG